MFDELMFWVILLFIVLPMLEGLLGKKGKQKPPPGKERERGQPGREFPGPPRQRRSPPAEPGSRQVPGSTPGTADSSGDVSEESRPAPAGASDRPWWESEPEDQQRDAHVRAGDITSPEDLWAVLTGRNQPSHERAPLPQGAPPRPAPRPEDRLPREGGPERATPGAEPAGAAGRQPHAEWREQPRDLTTGAGAIGAQGEVGSGAEAGELGPGRSGDRDSSSESLAPVAGGDAFGRRSAATRLLGNRGELRRAIILKEVLGPPKALDDTG